MPAQLTLEDTASASPNVPPKELPSAMRLHAIGLRRLVPLFAVLAAGCATLVDTIPPETSTRSAMHDTFDRIDAYIKENGTTPRSLSALPSRDRSANRTTDAWGRELHYNVADDGTITLTSLGADGKAGGHGEDSDISMYRPPESPGSSSDGSR